MSQSELNTFFKTQVGRNLLRRMCSELIDYIPNTSTSELMLCKFPDIAFVKAYIFKEISEMYINLGN